METVKLNNCLLKKEKIYIYICNLHATSDKLLNYDLLKSQLSPLFKIQFVLQFFLHTGPILVFSVLSAVFYTDLWQSAFTF